jgi:hypothetical protein
LPVEIVSILQNVSPDVSIRSRILWYIIHVRIMKRRIEDAARTTAVHSTTKSTIASDEGVQPILKVNWTRFIFIEHRGTITLLHSLRNTVCMILQVCDDTDCLRAAQTESGRSANDEALRFDTGEKSQLNRESTSGSEPSTTLTVKNRSSTISKRSCFDLDGQTFS